MSPGMTTSRASAALPGDVEIVTAGFPCQDLSQAGRPRGIGGDRSGLVSEVFRLIDDHRTPLVVLENVSFMLRLDGGGAIATLVAAFEERGYRWAYRVVNSLAFGCRSDGSGSTSRVALRHRSRRGPLRRRRGARTSPRPDLDTHAHGFYWTEGIRGLGWAAGRGPTLKNGSTIGIPHRPRSSCPRRRSSSPTSATPSGFRASPRTGRSPPTPNGRTSRRWALVGQRGNGPRGRMGGGPDRCGDSYEPRARPAGRWTAWPRAARGNGTDAYEVKAGDYPAFAPRVRFTHSSDIPANRSRPEPRAVPSPHRCRKPALPRRVPRAGQTSSRIHGACRDRCRVTRDEEPAPSAASLGRSRPRSRHDRGVGPRRRSPTARRVAQ